MVVLGFFVDVVVLILGVMGVIVDEIVVFGDCFCCWVVVVIVVVVCVVWVFDLGVVVCFVFLDFIMDVVGLDENFRDFRIGEDCVVVGVFLFGLLISVVVVVVVVLVIVCVVCCVVLLMFL